MVFAQMNRGILAWRRQRLWPSQAVRPISRWDRWDWEREKGSSALDYLMTQWAQKIQKRHSVTCFRFWRHRLHFLHTYIYRIYPPHSNSSNQDYYIFSRESLQTFICHCYWVGVDPRYTHLLLLLSQRWHFLVCPFFLSPHSFYADIQGPVRMWGMCTRSSTCATLPMEAGELGEVAAPLRLYDYIRSPKIWGMKICRA